MLSPDWACLEVYLPGLRNLCLNTRLQLGTPCFHPQGSLSWQATILVSGSLSTAGHVIGVWGKFEFTAGAATQYDRHVMLTACWQWKTVRKWWVLSTSLNTEYGVGTYDIHVYVVNNAMNTAIKTHVVLSWWSSTFNNNMIQCLHNIRIKGSRKETKSKKSSLGMFSLPRFPGA